MALKVKASNKNRLIDIILVICQPICDKCVTKISPKKVQ